MSGQMSGQVRNQIPQQNVNSMQPQLQNFGRGGNSHWGRAFPMDPELIKARQFMTRKIITLLATRHQQAMSDAQKMKFINIAKRLEDGLFKSSLSKDDYLNMDTLEQRLQEVIRRSSSNRNQPVHQHVSLSSSTSTVMPTPGISQHGSSNLMAMPSVDTSVAPSSKSLATSNINTGSFLPTGNSPSVVIPSSSFHKSDGYPSNGFQQSPAVFLMGSGGNHVSSLGRQRTTSQMIPTPGLSSNSIHSDSSMGSGNGDGCSTVDPTTGPRQHQKKPHVVGQNSHALRSLSNHSGGGIRSGLQQQSFGSSNGGIGKGLGVTGKNAQLGNVSETSEGQLTATSHASSANQLPTNFDQFQKHLMHGDGDDVNNAEPSVPGNSRGVVASVDSANIVPGNNTSLMNNQPNFHDRQQDPHVTSQLIDHADKMNFHYSSISRENGLHHHAQQHQRRLQEQQYQLNPKHGQEHLMPKNVPLAETRLNSGSQAMREPGVEDVALLVPKQESHGNYGNLPNIVKPDCMMQNQLHSHPQKTNQLASSMLHVQSVQEKFQQRISALDEAQPDKFSSERSAMDCTIASKCPDGHLTLVSSACRSGGSRQEEKLKNQRRWLLFVYHARRCPAPEGKCPESYCVNVQNLWKHIKGCNSLQCVYPRCQATKLLIHHNKHCRDPGCPVCVPVREYFAKHQMKHNLNTGEAPGRSVFEAPSENKEDFHPPLKRIKTERLPSPKHGEDKSEETTAISESCLSMDVQQQENNNGEVSMPAKSEVTEVKAEAHVSSSGGSESSSEMKEDNANDRRTQISDRESNRPLVTGSSNQENIELQQNSKIHQENMIQKIDSATGVKSAKSKVKAVSLTELFTPEQVREHIHGLRQWFGQSKAKAEKNQARENLMSEGACQLCAVERFTFEPPPLYCSTCGVRIKRNAMYYTGGGGETRHYFCIPCYNESRRDVIHVDGISIPKARLEKKKNDEETEEWWVQCDKCEAWQHQICALFNGRRNDGGQAEYTCPNCYIVEVERGDRKPLPQSAVLGAKDLPTTDLSDHIEQRLLEKLSVERQKRANLQGKSVEEVPGAEALVVRVVSSVDKKLEVKQRFLEIFQEQNYPTEFPYKSKVVLLFQKIEGVEVCLFGMYVQEFGSECAFPNQRRVYLSYLDSVKYFRPDIRSVTGEALRTFVYHEILIGYLDYCKKRGFTSCYIWACPPLKGEDYILYCHPEIQKTPKSDKLREWYLKMLKKASDEDIVVDLTNLYDHFFTQKGECKAKVTAARLPYFDGDYWPGAAEDLILQIQQEEDGRKHQKKGLLKKPITKRALKSSALSGLSGNASKDLLLMNKLGESISPMKEDFIMVHLQHCCSHCCSLMVSGTRWVCQDCKFQLCDKCYELECSRDVRERHPVNQKEKHIFNAIEITDVPAHTEDTDDILESEFFDTRQAFLSLCQGNHYQYDTLRRAKHSSMMVLYHLHNPTAPAFVTTCNVCYVDIDAGQGWRCEVCPEYDVCNTCYQKDGGISHPHKLTKHLSVADCDAQSKEARQLRVQQLRKMLELLVHSSTCSSPQCRYANCRKLRGLFRHGMQCRMRASGGCALCKKMWYLLQLHARACRESVCNVPRCRDLKEHLRRLQRQAESRRRAAVNEMMRQRSAQVGGGR